ncbi:MAG: TRAP transporter large permease subunit, partial [Gammaproteobacteria bacterium]|nr:TRAP transporter large permease subunit [Gammaproteobacteria bacterium]
AVLLYALLIAQVSPLRAGLIGALSCIALGALKKESRLGLGQIASALFLTMKNSIMVIAACALAGVVVGVLGLSGLGLNIANIILSYSMGFLPLALLLATVVAIILGLGMPTTASYIICAAIIAPGLVEMGVTAMGAHLFVLYFANMSNITPPVALACYGASSIAQANPVDVSIKAFKLGLVGFLIPFAWVYGPQLIMDGAPLSIAYTAMTALIGVLALGVSLQGVFGMQVLGWPLRLLAASVAVLLVVPGVLTDGLAAAAILSLTMLVVWRNSKTSSAADVS